jgi:mxaC protein
MSTLHFLKPELLWALPLALLPMFSHGLRQFSFPGLDDWPEDRASRLLRWGLRWLACLTVACLLLAAAGPFTEGGTVTRAGNGAEIVVVLDRSGSMSESLAGTVSTQVLPGLKTPEGFVSKISTARNVLEQFMQLREADTFGLVVFNSSPISVAPLSADRELAEAALKSAEARSVGFTAMSRALGMGLDYFRDRPVTTNRLILLVSDGDAIIEGADREYLRRAFNRLHAQLIWIYVRGDREPSIMTGQIDSASLSMHHEFGNMGMPYQAFEVTDAVGLQKAVSEVGRLTNQPTQYEYRLPRRDLAPALYLVALLLLCALVWIKQLEITAWKPAHYA